MQVKVLSQLKHPNVVSYQESFEGVLFICCFFKFNDRGGSRILRWLTVLSTKSCPPLPASIPELSGYRALSNFLSMQGNLERRREKHFLFRINPILILKEGGCKTSGPSFSKVRSRLMGYHWMGGVMQLHNFIRLLHFQ